MKFVRLMLLVAFIFTLGASDAAAQQTAEDFYKKGVEIMKSGRYEPAIPFFDEAIKLNSNYVEAFLQRSRAKQNNQMDLKGAFEDVETVLQINPQMGEAYFERAQIRNSLILKMLKEKGSMTMAEILPFKKLLLEDLNSAIDNGFKNKRIYSYRAGILSRDFDNQTDAIKDYTAAMSFDPDDFHLLNNRALAKRQNDDFQGAIADLREIIRRYDEAKTDNKVSAQKLDSLKGGAVFALNNLSSTYALSEDTASQMWAIEKSIELQPTASAYLSRGRHKMIFGSLDDAITDYNKAIEMSGGKIGRYILDRGIVYHLQGKVTEAQADFEQAVKLEPHLKRSVNYWLELARRQREQKRVRVELPK